MPDLDQPERRASARAAHATTSALAARVLVLEALAKDQGLRIVDLEAQGMARDERVRAVEHAIEDIAKIKEGVAILLAWKTASDDKAALAEATRLAEEKERRDDRDKLNARLKAVSSLLLVIFSLSASTVVNRWNSAAANIVLFAAVGVIGLALAWIYIRTSPGGETK